MNRNIFTFEVFRALDDRRLKVACDVTQRSISWEVPGVAIAFVIVIFSHGYPGDITEISSSSRL